MNTDTISVKVGRNIKKLRELKNFTQEYFAEQLDMTTSGYSKIERGEVGLNLDKLQKIASLLEMDITDVLAFDESVVFNNFGSVDGVLGQSFGNNIGIDVSTIVEAYDGQIASLKSEIAFLREIVSKK